VEEKRSYLRAAFWFVFGCPKMNNEYQIMKALYLVSLALLVFSTGINECQSDAVEGLKL